MSEPISALGGVIAKGPVSITELPPFGMVTLRAELSKRDVAAALKEALGVAVPKQRKIAKAGDIQVAWMAPDELMCLTTYDGAQALADKLSAALAGHHHMAVVVSDARASFTITGASAESVIPKVAPVDMQNLAKDEIRRTRFAQVSAAFWRIDGGFQVICFRSVASYMFELLKKSANP